MSSFQVPVFTWSACCFQGTMLIFVMEDGTNLSQMETIVLAVGVPVTVAWTVAAYITVSIALPPLLRSM